LADLAISGRRVEIQVRVRRWRCLEQSCPARTFAGQIDGLTVRYARRTAALRRTLQDVALALAGRAGARLCAQLAVPASRSSLLRLLRALPDPPAREVTVVGVDDFAVRRGHRYGTVLVDLDSRRPVDLLPDREAGTVAGWLAGQPSVAVVCRDRAGAYADAAARGAAQAIQVADRWHLWHNLAHHVQKAAARHRRCVTAVQHPEPAPAPAIPTSPPPAQTGCSPGSAYAIRWSEQHRRVHELLSNGCSLKGISRELGLARGTVRRLARAATVEELLPGPRIRHEPRLLDAHTEYLQQRWACGVTNATALFKEIQARGYRGGYTAVQDHVRPWRSAPPPTTTPPKPLSARQISSLLLRDPDNLDPDELAHRAGIRDACPDLNRLAEHVTSFAIMITSLRGDRLDNWLTTVETDNQPDLWSFAAGIRRDYDAVRNGLTLHHNSGPVEGHVNRIKMIKRQMYGRANLDLLRKRVLLA
jgi:transposase